MIVYTATDEVNGKVYVGSTREDLEEHWIALVNQAEDGADGDFFAAIRHQGADKFEIEEFGYADSSAETRALIREAQEDLGAVAVKAGRGSTVVSRTKVQAAKVELDQGLALSGETDGEGQTEHLKTETLKTESAAITVKKTSDQKATATPINSSLDLVKQALAEAAASVDLSQGLSQELPKKSSAAVKEKLATGRAGSSSKEKRIKETIQREREAREQFRQTGSTQEAAKMKDLMMGIEARRLAARKTSKEARLVEARKKAAADRKAKAVKKAVEANRVESMKRVLGQNTATDSSAEEAKLSVKELSVKKATSKKDSRTQAKLLAANILSARTEKP